LRTAFVCTCITATGVLFSGGARAEDQAVQITRGTASFVATTNVSAISVHGASDTLTAAANVREEGRELVLERIDARLDAKRLSSGMELRDQHMREKVFTGPDGNVAELRFESAKAVCPAPAAGQVAACDVSGTFFLRGVGRAFHMALKIKPDAQPKSYRVNGDGTLKLTAYGIEPPSQLGIRISDDVKVHVEFVAAVQGGERASR
jgi:polyisoprenoid-binding protein YceI